MFASPHPDRYPLNTGTALIINVGIGWSTYLLAALLGRQAIWLGIATVLVSIGNVVAHGILFNVKGRTLYNPGMFTAIVLLVPIAIALAIVVIGNDLASGPDWAIGILLGLGLNYLGIVKLIDRLKDPDTRFVFPPRSLLPAR